METHVNNELEEVKGFLEGDGEGDFDEEVVG